MNEIGFRSRNNKFQATILPELGSREFPRQFYDVNQLAEILQSQGPSLRKFYDLMLSIHLPSTQRRFPTSYIDAFNERLQEAQANQYHRRRIAREFAGTDQAQNIVGSEARLLNVRLAQATQTSEEYPREACSPTDVGKIFSVSDTTVRGWATRELVEFERRQIDTVLGNHKMASFVIVASLDEVCAWQHPIIE
jgi:hypothetical protein